MFRPILTLIVVGSLACATQTDSEVAVTTEPGAEGQVMSDTTMTMQTAPLPSWEVSLEPTSREFDVAGQGRVNALPDGQTRVSVEIRGAEPNAQHPWHLHEGRCESGGEIVGDPAAYELLTVAGDGSASGSATIDVDLGEDPDGDYHINVHQSPTETETIVSCGVVRGTF